MQELILDEGTVIVDSLSVKNTVRTHIIGRKFENSDGNLRGCVLI
jgi:hypothetical protein